MRFQTSFFALPGPDDLVILSQTTLREVLGVDVMQSLKWIVLKLREAATGGGPRLSHASLGKVKEW